jgi:hypothetical protein
VLAARLWICYDLVVILSQKFGKPDIKKDLSMVFKMIFTLLPFTASFPGNSSKPTVKITTLLLHQ